MTLLAAALLSEAADLLTYRPASETNLLVVAMGPTAPVAKLLLIVGIAVVALALRLPGDPKLPGLRPYRLAAANVLLVAGVVVGLFGALSNL